LAINQGFSPRKNTSTLIQAWPLVRNRFPEARLAMLGSGHGPGEAAEAWALSRGLREGIAFLGLRPYDEVQRLLKEEADLFVHPSLEECCPMVVLEAEAAGLPVVGGRCSGGVPYVMGDGQAGLLVDVRNPATLAEGICRLLEDEGLRKQTGARAKGLVEERFTLDRVADQYLRLLGDLAQGGVHA
jgi:glycosyltransferase involved in cell wall biosynthesis